MAEGMPNDQTFPFESIDVKLKDGTSFQLEGEELNMAFQYIPSTGHPKLLSYLKEFHYKLQRPPLWHRCELMVTNGSQDGICKAIEMCIEEGDPVIVQNPLYSGTAMILNPYNPEILAIDEDQFGMIPSILRKVLRERKRNCMTNKAMKMPKMLYVNPTGSNPSGSVMTLERKKQIYKICCQYNILILEDDPYIFVHYLNVS